MKIIFFGSDDFALTSLEKLGGSAHKIVAVVTQPDRPKGRGFKITASPIKEYAGRHNIPVLQPRDIKEKAFLNQLKEYNCDLFVVIAYGRILTPELLQIPYVCALNIHGSLLPKYRGAAPINWAIINGEATTGVSIIKMNARMDAGDIFSQEEITIKPQDTAPALRKKMAEKGAKLLLKTIKSIEDNQYTLTVQDKAKVTLAPKLTKEMGMISWKEDAKRIHNLVRGLTPWPSAYTRLGGKLLKILKTEVIGGHSKEGKPGEIVETAKDSFTVACGEGALLVKEVQLESSRPMDVKSFFAGHKLSVGDRLK